MCGENAGVGKMVVKAGDGIEDAGAEKIEGNGDGVWGTGGGAMG